MHGKKIAMMSGYALKLFSGMSPENLVNVNFDPSRP